MAPSVKEINEALTRLATEFKNLGLQVSVTLLPDKPAMKPEFVSCQVCNGTGRVEYSVWTGWEFTSREGDCETCKGTGEVRLQEPEPDEKGEQE